jgi:hypothetical protein
VNIILDFILRINLMNGAGNVIEEFYEKQRAKLTREIPNDTSLEEKVQLVEANGNTGSNHIPTSGTGSSGPK